MGQLGKMTIMGLAVATGAVTAAAALAGNGSAAGPEVIWLVQSAPTTEGNAGALQMQKELVMQLKRIGVDYPDGQYMTMDQVDRLNALFNLKEDEVSTRDQAKIILGM
jgi:hypothetical protein